VPIRLILVDLDADIVDAQFAADVESGMVEVRHGSILGDVDAA
jgi:hypothetical protein